MKTATRRTALCAVVLAVLAAGAPFLCLIPLFAPAEAGDTADTSEPAPAAQTPAPSPAVSRAPGAQPEAILLWDEAAGRALSVSAKEYLMGAAACEMPIDWPDDALQAQMVASHSYALYQLAHNESSGAALSVNSAQCSGWTTRAVLESRWGDSFAENWQRLSDLAEEVPFDLVLYQGEPAAACYHAISSGHTQASQRVWQESLPYLQGVDSPWDKYAQDYEVTVQYTSQQVSDCLYSALGIHVSGDPSTWVGTRCGTTPAMWTISPCAGRQSLRHRPAQRPEPALRLLCPLLAGGPLCGHHPGLRPRRRPEPGGRPGHGRRGQQLAGYPALLLSRHPDRPGKLKTGRPLPLTGRAALFLVLFTGQALSG